MKNKYQNLNSNLKKCIFLLLYFFTITFYGQDDSFRITNKNSTEYNNNSTSSGINVDMYKGKMNTSIPLYLYSGREFNLPISLNYTANGIKVDQVASEVGLGWSLNVGGKITRVVNGIPDDKSNGIPECNDYEGENSKDYFTINSLGINDVCSFITQATVASFTNPKIKIESSDYGLGDWVVIAEDGTKFYFGQNNNREKLYSISSSSTAYNCPDIDVNSTTTWLLTKIISKNNLDIYTFNYQVFEWSDMIHNNGDGSYTYNSTKLINSSYKLKQLNIADIFHNGEKVISFNYGARNDLKFVGGENVGNALQDILIYKFKSSEIAKKINFEYSYFGNQSSLNFVDKRLKLNTITFKYPNPDNTSSYLDNSKYSFEYFELDDFPSITSYARDYLGLYNGQNNNLNLLPNYNNRTFNFTKSLAGTLRKIHYPNKGFSEIEYEQNALCGGYGNIMIPEQTITQTSIVDLAINVNVSICDEVPIKFRGINEQMSPMQFTSFPNSGLYAGTGTQFYCDQAKTILMDLSTESPNTVYNIETSGTGIYLIQSIDSCNSTTSSSYPECEYINGQFLTSSTYADCLMDTRNIIYNGNTIPERFVEGGLTNRSLASNSFTRTFQPGKYQVTVWRYRNYGIEPLPDFDNPSVRISKTVTSNIVIPSHPENQDIIDNLVDGFRVKSISSYSKSNSISNKREYKYQKGLMVDKPNILKFDSSTNITTHYSSGYANYPDIVHYTTVFEVLKDTNGNDNGYTQYNFLQSNQDCNAVNLFQNLNVVRNFPFHYSVSTNPNAGYPQIFSPSNYEGNHLLRSKKIFDKDDTLQLQESYNYEILSYNIYVGQQLVRSYPQSYTKEIKSINYFTENNQIENSIEYWRDPIDFQIYSKMEKNGNIEITTSYDYTTLYDNSNTYPIEVPTYMEDTRIKQSKIYSVQNGRNLLTEIQSSKPNEPLEPKTRFEYDTDGNMVSTVQVTPGIIANNQWDSFIYGYDNRFVVAKLTGIKYSDIPPALINDIKSASNQAITPTSITAMENALNALRNSTDINLQNAQITTYTYNPVFGITSVTDPKGMTIYTEYDTFGRVKLTKEKAPDGSLKILSENQYNTRPN